MEMPFSVKVRDFSVGKFGKRLTPLEQDEARRQYGLRLAADWAEEWGEDYDTLLFDITCWIMGRAGYAP